MLPSRCGQGLTVCTRHPTSTRRSGVIPNAADSANDTGPLDRVGVTGCLVGAAAGHPPGHDAGLVLGQAPARRLLGLVMPSAQGREIAQARSASSVESHRVVGVAARGRPSATGIGAGGMPDLDQMAQPGRGPVRGRLRGMITVAARQERKAEGPGPVGSADLGPAGRASSRSVTWAVCRSVAWAAYWPVTWAVRRSVTWAAYWSVAGASSACTGCSGRPLSVARARWGCGAGASVGDGAAM